MRSVPYHRGSCADDNASVGAAGEDRVSRRSGERRDGRARRPRAILAEWSKIGGTNIVNGERVTGAPLTLKLVDVPEAQALEIILRSVAGYMAAPRGQTPGASRYDRILVLPTSTTRVAANPTPRQRAGEPGWTGMGTRSDSFRRGPHRPSRSKRRPSIEEPGCAAGRPNPSSRSHSRVSLPNIATNQPGKWERPR